MVIKLKKKFTGKSRRYLPVVFLVAGIIAVFPGCGGQEAVETDAPAQAEGEAEIETGADAAGTEEEQQALEEELNAAREQTDSARAQMEIEQGIREELTEELLEEQELDTSVMEFGRSTKGCTFDIPEGFEAFPDMEGVYVTGRYPIDASSIYYTEAEQDKSLQLLTEELFKEQTQESLKEAYDEDVEVAIDSFEHIEIDGYPAFRILCHYQVGRIQITQLEYAINADKSYVITYSQTNDYDRMEAYEASAATIHVE